MSILIIEDEPKLAEFIRQGLEENGYSTEIALDGKLGLAKALESNFDLVILDVIIPEVSGIDVCKGIRAEKPNMPVIMLTALDTLSDKQRGFDAGADDYLVKPFEFRELLMRVKALTRRVSVSSLSSHVLKVKDLELDLDLKLARRGGKEIALTAKEYQLLEFLMRNKNRVLSRSEIATKVWEINFDTGTNIIDVYINFLRKKIDAGFDLKLIQTQIGMGYIFKDI
ncbi:MAG TPA: response regulator transcription factor [Flavobacteriales bacterium]|nr:response regulator transcription factor [Flavobacteriales bacterium]